MTHRVLLALALAAPFAATAVAAEPVPGSKLGTSLEAIEAALAADGYEMTYFEREGARLEVYAVGDGVRHELRIDPVSGEVVEAERYARRGPSPLPGPGDDVIRARLASEGYDISKYERERGEIEVYAVKDGRRWELKIDPRSGRTLRSEADD